MSLRRPKMQIKPKVSLRSATLKPSVDNQMKQSVDFKPIGSPVKEHRTVEQMFDAVKSPATPMTTKVTAVIDSENELNGDNDSHICSKDTVPERDVESEAIKTTFDKKIISEDTNQSSETKDKNMSETQNEVKYQIKTETKPKLKTETTRKRKLSRKDHKSDKSIMRMKDLLLYNPPLTEEQKEMREKDAEQSDTAADNPPMDSKPEPEEKPVKDVDNSGPRVKVGTDGLLILDEESVVVKHKKSEALNETPLLESAGTTSALTNYSSFRNKSKGSSKPRWTETETIRFYSALNTIGTDFTLMADLFFRGKRTRLDLRNKFKKEEKTNKLMIDEALFSTNTFINHISPQLEGLLNDLTDSDDDSEDQTVTTKQQKTTKSKT